MSLPLATSVGDSGNVVISEVMANPSPPVHLPEYEYVELLNCSDRNIELEGWTFTYGNTTKTFPKCLLPAGNYLLLIHSEAALSMTRYGAILPLLGSLSSISNSGQYLCLRNAEGTLVAWIDFTTDWYDDPLKADGGWSLEMIDATQPCSGPFNWRASIDRHGGTPAQPNSVAAANPDMTAPHFAHIAVPDEHTILLYVSKPISENAATVTITPTLPVAASTIVGRRLDQLQLTLDAPVEPNLWYELLVEGATADCAGFAVPPADFRFALPQPADSQDVVINEIMFRPLPEGEAFVEIFNRSQKAIAVNELQLTMRNASGKLATPDPLSDEPFLLLPGQYIVVARHTAPLIAQYGADNLDCFIDMLSMPQLTRESGQLVLLNRSLNVIDEVHYDIAQHTDALNESSGVSLERVNPDRSSLDPDNWHTAAQTVGFATPGRQNSQFIELQAANDGITIEPEVFSPNNDGIDDQLVVKYRFDTPSLTLDVKIFDSAGRCIRNLFKQQIAESEGIILWDGFDEKRRQALTGVYVVYINAYNSSGYSKSYRLPCVLAGQK